MLQEYPVSSLLGSFSREQTRSILFTRERERTSVTQLGGPVTTAAAEEKPNELQERVLELEEALESIQKKYDEL